MFVLNEPYIDNDDLDFICQQMDELMKQIQVLEEDANRIEESLSKQKIAYANMMPVSIKAILCEFFHPHT